jgi:hypothetical protein
MTPEQTTLAQPQSERLSPQRPSPAPGIWQELFPRNAALRQPSLPALLSRGQNSAANSPRSCPLARLACSHLGMHSVPPKRLECFAPFGRDSCEAGSRFGSGNPLPIR